MSNLKKFALQPTSVLHLRDGNDDLMYVDGPDGKPDLTRPMRVRLFGPGTKRYAAAYAAQSNRNLERFKAKGKSGKSAEEQTTERAKFLTQCTDGFENVEDGDLTGDALAMAVYSDLELCFIPAQVDEYIGNTANFTGASSKD